MVWFVFEASQGCIHRPDAPGITGPTPHEARLELSPNEVERESVPEPGGRIRT
jgi:hypothetical protein